MVLAPKVQEYAADTVQGAHRHDTASVSLVLNGLVSEDVGGPEWIAGPLDLVIKPAGILHRNRYGPSGARVARFEFPRLPEELPTWRWIRPGPAAGAFLSLCATLPLDEETLLTELTAILPPDCGPEPNRPPSWLLRVRDRIRDETPHRTRVSELAREAGVHPVHLARTHRRCFGHSVVEAQQLARVRLAFCLMTTGTSLADVAYGAGFSDQSHMTRVFRTLLGDTPGALQKRLRLSV